MQRPKAMLVIDTKNERYEMFSVEPLCDHDGDKARQHIATIYDHAEAHEILRLWNTPNAGSHRQEEAGQNEWDEKQGCFVPERASSCTCGLHCSADDVCKIRHCIGLLNSMVLGGEQHSYTSARMTVEALEALEHMEQPNADI